MKFDVDSEKRKKVVSRWHLFLTNLHYNYVSVVCEFYSFMDLEHCSKHGSPVCQDVFLRRFYSFICIITYQIITTHVGLPRDTLNEGQLYLHTDN